MFNFELTEEEANYIVFALGKQPAENSMGLILKLQQQAKSQDNKVVDEDE